MKRFWGLEWGLFTKIKVVESHAKEVMKGLWAVRKEGQEVSVQGIAFLSGRLESFPLANLQDA